MLNAALTPLSWLYERAIRARNARYDRGVGVHPAPVHCISVGNLTVGGTGKTPMVIALGRALLDLGRHPAILTRGYAARAGGVADEVQEYREVLPGVPVVVDADRVRGAEAARSQHGADCVVLDDGFQHRRLHRNLDIVLIDALNPWGGRRLLPAGRLREPIDSLRRADLVVITRANQEKPEHVAVVRAEAARYLDPRRIVLAGVAPLTVSDAAGERLPAIRTLLRYDVVGACGIGNPATFLRSLLDCGCRPHLVEFPDHHHYTAADVERIEVEALRCNAAYVVTTRKDWGKLRPLWPPTSTRLLRLDVQTTWIENGAAVEGALAEAIRGRAGMGA